MDGVTIKSIFNQILEPDIKSVESLYGISFPDDYRKFLLENNGGFPSPKTFTINISQGESLIDVFYGLSIGDKYKHLELRNNITQTRTSMPTEVIPIGVDPGGNYVCICVKGVNKNKIYFFDRERSNTSDGGELNWDNLYLVANTFTEFIDKLH